MNAFLSLHLVAEIPRPIEAGVFVPNPGWHCRDCPFQSRS